MKPGPQAVSILIPMRNAEPWVERLVASIASQNDPHLEVVVVDDASTDGSREAVRQALAATAVPARLFANPDRRGAGHCRNLAACHAVADWVLYLDADDELSPEAIAGIRATRVLETEADLVLFDHEEIGPSGEFLQRRSKPIDSSDPVGSLLTLTGISLMPLLVRRRVAEALRWREELPCAQEWDFVVRCALAGQRVRHEPVVVGRMRQHSDHDRISVSTAERLPQVLAELALGYRQSLIAVGRLSPRARGRVAHLVFNAALHLAMAGRLEELRALSARFDRWDLLHDPAYRPVSARGLSLLTGIRYGALLGPTLSALRRTWAAGLRRRAAGGRP